MTRPILVPLDGSKNSEPALAAAKLLVEAEGARILVVHILDREQDQSSLRAANEAFARYGEDLAATYELPLGRYSFQVFQGCPARTILALAGQASWIAIASHGRSGFRAMVIGSVADKVIRGATVPVFLVPGITGGTRLPNRILVGLDGSEESERALPVARRLAALTEAEVTLLRAVSYFLPVAWELAYYPVELPAALIEGAEDYLKRIAEPREQIRVRRGLPATEIELAAAELDVDLVVLTSSGMGLAGRLAVGSTTDRVMHSLHRQLVIIPPSP